ncbi:DNA-directed DNA polymerase [Tanacetum coccineum]
MTFEATYDKEINKANDDHNEPFRFQHDEQGKPQEVVVENESLKVQERTIQPLMESQQPSIPFPNLLRKEKGRSIATEVFRESKTTPYQYPIYQSLNLGASISLIPYTMYGKLGLGEPKPTRMSLELADRSIQYPRGIVENVLIKVDKFVLPIDFVILDMPEDFRIPIILGRPFLATARAMIDVFNKKITLKVGDDEVIFDMEQSVKKPSIEDDECYSIDETINEETHVLLENEQLDLFLHNNLEKRLLKWIKKTVIL